MTAFDLTNTIIDGENAAGRCGTCRWFGNFECRRHAPIAVEHTERRESLQQLGPGAYVPHVLRKFPPTNEWDFCGDYELGANARWEDHQLAELRKRNKQDGAP